MKEKRVDIEEIIKSKNPRLLKMTPRFLIRYLKRKLHEDEVNKALADTDGKDGLFFATYCINKFNIKIEATGLENIPKTGGVTLVINHPIGGLDAMAMIIELHKIRKDYKFVVNDILLNIDSMKDIFIGVNKHGANTKIALEELDNVFASEQATMVFPAGLVSRRRRGKVEDLEWKKTFVTRAKKYNRDVVPVLIDGNLSTFFYRLSNFRKLIGIKANIEMLYLIDEQFKQEDKTITLNFGKPIPASTFDRTKTDQEWAQWVKKKVYQLGKKK